MPDVMKAQTAAISMDNPSAWYLSAMERLVGVVQELSQTRDVDAITAIARDAARSLTGADGVSFILRDGDQCYYADENAIEPLWKGKRFPMSACVSGWVMLNKQSTIIPDIYNDPRVPVEAYRPTFVKSMAMVPIRSNAPIGAIGNYWASTRRPTEEEVAILQALADTTSVALENAELYGQLRQQVRTLEKQQERITAQHATLEVFTRALAHDLKEPVRTMMSYTRMLQESHDAPEKRETYFRFIQNAADRMGMLINSVFQYTQLDDIEGTPRKPCAVDKVLQGVEENLVQLIAESGATITHHACVLIEINPTHLMQLLQNLISNAIRHNKEKVQIEVQAQDKGDHWLLCVRDNGVGIAAGQLTDIFKPFKRLTHKEGCSGLGLAVCKKIADAYDGEIWCESIQGKGSAFFFKLPKLASAKQAKKAASVLLVDDLEADIELAQHTMKRDQEREYKVLVAHDGEEAYAILKETTGKEDVIDVLLLDINMPCMNGFELLEKIRSDVALKDTAVIMCSGSEYSDDKHRAKALGAIGYLVKPPSVDKLKNLMNLVPALQVGHKIRTTV